MTEPIPVSKITGLAKNYGRGVGRYMASNTVSMGVGGGIGGLVGGAYSMISGDDHFARDTAAGSAIGGIGLAVAAGGLGKVGMRGLEKGGLKGAGMGMLKMLRRLGR